MDQRYWNKYYDQHIAPEEPSSFAKFCLPNILAQGGSLFELGCGNGRDAIYFAHNRIPVWACDESTTAVDSVRQKSSFLPDPRPNLIVANFSQLKFREFEVEFAAIYSRFTLHAVDRTSASRTLSWSYDNLAPSGKMYIEVRSVESSLHGQGTPVERDAFIFGHYRRFVRKAELLGELGALGFTIEYAIESNGLAIYKDDDPVVIRVIARK